MDLVQGYLVRKDADPNQPLETRAQSAVSGITYATMRISVKPLETSPTKPNSAAGAESPCPSGGKKGSGK